MEVKLSAPGKVILHGEHSVVYGKSAIAASINKRTHVCLKEQESFMCEQDRPKPLLLHLPCMKVRESFSLDELNSYLFEIELPLVTPKSKFSWQKPKYIDQAGLLEIIVKYLQRKYGEDSFSKSQHNSVLAFFYLYVGILGSVQVDRNPCEILVTSELTLSSGTGSSASYCVTLAATFIQYIRLKLCTAPHTLDNMSKSQYKPLKPYQFQINEFSLRERKIISNWAWYAEKIIHGNPSGIDNSVCSYGRVIEYRLGKCSKPVNMGAELRILLVNTRVCRDTKQLVAKVAALKEKQPEKVNDTLLVLDELAMKAREHIITINHLTQSNGSTSGEERLYSEYKKLSDLFAMNHCLLRDLGVSHPSLDEICAIASTYGLSGKLTGAGGGGYAIILLTPWLDQSKESALIHQLQEAGFIAEPIKIGGPGVTIENNVFEEQ